MTVLRMDHVGIIVRDLPAAVAFFQELGLTLQGEASLGGELVDRIIALDGVRSNIAMLATPDGHAQLELCSFDAPDSPDGGADAPGHAVGIRHVTFAVDDVEATLERLRPHGAQLVGELVRYGDSYLVCYVRGPEGIIVELGQPLG